MSFYALIYHFFSNAVEEDAYLAAKDAMMKALAESTSRTAQEMAMENAARAYRAHHGKRNDSLLQDMMDACLAEKELWYITKNKPIDQFSHRFHERPDHERLMILIYTLDT